MIDATIPSERERAKRLLLRKAVEQLRKTWRDINYCYLRERLRPPVIEVRPLEARWGTWSLATRTIVLSERLVLEHPWHAVVEVLKHETAHQIVDELLRPGDVMPHGEAFKRACEIVACSPVASGDPTAGASTVRAEADPDGDGRLRRVRRLLALADSPNVHEAEAALAKANELLLKHNLDVVAAKLDRSYVARQVGPLYTRRPRHVKIAAGILADHFFVEVIWLEGYDVLEMKTGKALEVCGTPDNVDLAEHTFHELLRAAAELWARHRSAERLTNRFRRQYLDGVMVGFGSRLERDRATLAETRDLVWLGDPELEAFYRRRHPRIGTESVSVGGTAAYQAGREAGEDLRLRRALREHRGDHGRALGWSGRPS